MHSYYQVFKVKGKCLKKMVFTMSKNLEKSINSLLNDYVILGDTIKLVLDQCQRREIELSSKESPSSTVNAFLLGHSLGYSSFSRQNRDTSILFEDVGGGLVNSDLQDDEFVKLGDDKSETPSTEEITNEI